MSHVHLPVSHGAGLHPATRERSPAPSTAHADGAAADEEPPAGDANREHVRAVEHAAPLPELSEGAYVLEWRALARDGHVMTGEISFSVTGGDA